jgi:hypothetical protein
MCLVIDANCFRLVFGKKHSGFTPVRNWIEDGNGRMIYGGQKYNRELKDWGMLGVVKELDTGRKTVHIPDAEVDAIEKELKHKFPEAAFDDEHIVALVITSGCRVVCTNDKQAMPYLKCRDVFANYAGVQRPKIYTGDKRHIKLCCAEHVVAKCRDAN